MSSYLPTLPTFDLCQRLIDAERQCMVDWLRAMEALPGNPLGVAIDTFGNAIALVCRAVQAEVFNRVIGLTGADDGQIPAILAFYAQHGATPVFDLSPYTIPPYWDTPNVPLVLARHGFYQGAFHQMLYGAPATDFPSPPAHLAIREVGPEDADTFVKVYEQVWGDGIAIRVLLGQPCFRCYLAYVEGEAAGLGVLHVANGCGSMANGLTIPALRGRGCQTALLHQRIADAARAGCDLIVSQCRPGMSSQNNQLRAGLRVAGTKAWWVPLPQQ